MITFRSNYKEMIRKPGFTSEIVERFAGSE